MSHPIIRNLEAILRDAEACLGRALMNIDRAVATPPIGPDVLIEIRREVSRTLEYLSGEQR